MTTLLTEHPASLTARTHRWTVKEFYQAVAAGVFQSPERLELVHGEIIENMPISPLHADTADYLAQCLRAVLSPRFRVREEKPIHIAFDGEPTPDISVVPAQRPSFGVQHPAPEEAELLIEVSVTSAEYDLGAKALLYAQAGIGDYWVVLPEAGEIVVHREPSPEGYRSVTRVGEDGTVAPLPAPQAALSVRELLGRPQPQE